MKTVCQSRECTGCKACVNVCARKAIRIADNMKYLDAVIDEQLCVDCGLCAKVCPNNTTVSKKEPLAWKQGWAKQEELRARGSSGGVAAAVTEAFIRAGGHVCSCLFEDGKFKFVCTNDLQKAREFAGSKYVKSDPGEIYEEIKRVLAAGEKCLFIGLPCQVAAVYNYVPQKLQEKLYTVDLICHGTPSEKLLVKFLKQNGFSLATVKEISFRKDTAMGLKMDGKTIHAPGTVDRWLLSFLNGINYTDHCYKCQYAAVERVADMTIGDHWGTEKTEEIPRGVSLILPQTEKGTMLMGLAGLVLFDADQEKALKSNGNLHHPSRAPVARETFFAELEKGKNYNKLVMKYFPKQCWRQKIKALAIRMKLR